MFENFTLDLIDVGDATLRVRYGGEGPPLLLLHGHPRTHATWHRVAPLLTDAFTVVCPDLPGFGQSTIPADTPNHAGSSKRVKAKQCTTLMRNLGFDRFRLVGHDRGSYTAFRTAMDFPDAVEMLAILDGVPILEALERCDVRFAKLWWHWFFFAQLEKPELAIMADPLAWYGGTPAEMGKEAYADFRQAVTNPRVVHGMLEDYRAGLSVDFKHDREDRDAGRRISCPLLVLWSLRDDMEMLYGDPLKVWQCWGNTVEGFGIDCGHHMSEEAPEQLAEALRRFFLYK